MVNKISLLCPRNTPEYRNNPHIYQIDGPGIDVREITADYDHVWMFDNFREQVYVKLDGAWYQCSPHYKWHSKESTKPKNATQMTRDSISSQKLGSGWLTIPANP